MYKRFCLLLCTLALAGCAAHTKHDRSYVAEALQRRTHAQLAPPAHATFTLPPNLKLTDSLSSEDAVALALWNNAQFQADLSELGFAKADLLEAGLLRNPMLSLLFPVGPKQLEYTLAWPIIDALWQRPKRVAVAKLEAERMAENLVQHGLALARTAMIAHADLLLAEQRAQFAREDESLRHDIAALAAARLRAGEISELEANATRFEALRGQETAYRFAQAAALARAQFNVLLGMAATDTTLRLSATSPVVAPEQSGATLLREAYAARPELRAAELAIAAAAKRVGWEHGKILNLIGVLDANGAGKQGFEIGPGVQMELPLFNWNNANVTRAQTQVEQAARQYTVVQQRIALEVTEAHTNYLAAQKSYALWHEQLLPAAHAAALQAEKAYAAGEVAYLFVLEVLRQRNDAHMQEAEAIAALRRAKANLTYSIGFHQ